MQKTWMVRLGRSGAACLVLASLGVACDASVDTLGSSAQKTQLQVINGDFGTDTSGWWGSNTTLYTAGGRLCADVPGGTINPWDVIVGQNDLVLEDGTFEFSFSASATPGGHVARSLVQLPVDPYTAFAEIPAALSEDPAEFSQTFTSPGPGAPLGVQFQLGGSADPWTFCVDDVSVAEPKVDVVVNGDFSDGQGPWWTTGFPLDVSTGEACATIPAGGDPWSAIIGQGGIELLGGSNYEFSFFVKGNGAANVRALVQLNADPWTGYIELNQQPGPDGTTYSGTFLAPSDVADAAVQFQVGGASEEWTFCADNVSLTSDAPIEYYTPDTGPAVRVNQHGYPAYGPKKGTFVTEETAPVYFAIQKADGTVVLSGVTVPKGVDPSAGTNVHTFDFSALTKVGDGFVAVIGDVASYPFSITKDPYETLRIDSLNFYYTQRSGIEIDGGIAGPLYARPAGHVSSPGSGDLNQGDNDVPCQPADNSAPIYGEPWTCDYTLDVRGGWYDAGDQGKYVVNGGIAVHQLLNIFERTGFAPNVDDGALADGSLAIPESDNGVPDLLDEVRWELEFFLKMIVPEGDPLAGMVHHKVHDHQWTGLPLLPHQDDKLRWLHRPSTAATLNLAATAAQAARIYKKYDKAFATTLLKAAENAWEAALEHPDLYAPLEDGASGGGPYNDADVTDEFYWAAAELYLTTEDCKYLDYVLDSPHHTGEVFTTAGFIWYEMAALARIDLATVPSKLPDLDDVQYSVLEGAELYLASQAASPFGQPYLTDDGEYVWGSNSQILNNIVVLAVAYDLSGDERYRAGALEGLDYVLGRNALNNSYVTGYGEVNAHNQHSRWYAHQLNPDLPNPPVGALSGGPNSHPGEWDPTMARLFGVQGCAPQQCYVDDVNSWSTNEITLNWNSTLAWVANWAADQDSLKSKAGCKKKYTGKKAKKAKKKHDDKVCKAGKQPKPKKTKKGVNNAAKKSAFVGPKFPGKRVPKYAGKH
jgi:endoglucanase